MLPFRKVRRVHVAVPVVVCVVLFTSQSLLPFVYGSEYHYMRDYRMCTLYIDEIYKRGTLAYYILFYWILVGNNIVPIIPVILSCMLTMYKLQMTPVGLTSEDKLKRRASVTIVLLTIVYCICNIPVCFLWGLYLWVADIFVLLGKNSWIVKLIAVYLISLNSLFNVIVYFCRIANFKEYVLGLLGSVRSHTKRYLVRKELEVSLVMSNRTQGTLGVPTNPTSDGSTKILYLIQPTSPV